MVTIKVLIRQSKIGKKKKNLKATYIQHQIQIY